eukprot:1146257-Pelagomonas_calceolata.AAC.3
MNGSVKEAQQYTFPLAGCSGLSLALSMVPSSCVCSNRDVQVSVVVEQSAVTEMALERARPSRRALLSSSSSGVNGKYISPNGHTFFYLTDSPVADSVAAKIQEALAQAYPTASSPPPPPPTEAATPDVDFDTTLPVLSPREPFEEQARVPDPLDPTTMLEAVVSRILVTGAFDAMWMDTGAAVTDDVDAQPDIVVSDNGIE